MNEQQLKDEIEARKECIASIETNLIYADHGAYGQDKEKIRRLKDEIALFEKELDEIKAAPSEFLKSIWAMIEKAGGTEAFASLAGVPLEKVFQWNKGENLPSERDALALEFHLECVKGSKAAPEPVEQDIVPQLTARRVLKISTRQTLGNWIARGRVTGHDVHGETWVSLKECRSWIANPARKGGRPMIRFD